METPCVGLAVCSLLETSVSMDYMDYVSGGDGYTRVTLLTGQLMNVHEIS